RRRVELAVDARPQAHDLVVADGQHPLAVAGEEHLIAVREPAARLDDEFRILTVTAIDLLSLKGSDDENGEGGQPESHRATSGETRLSQKTCRRVRRAGQNSHR